MEQDVFNVYRTACTTCLSSDRDLFSINGCQEIYEIFSMLMKDFPGDRYGDTTMDEAQMICWECLAYIKRFIKFKQQVHSAQEHLRILAISQPHETVDHTYMSQSLSNMVVTTKTDYDNIYFNYTQDEWSEQYMSVETGSGVKSEHYDVAQAVRDNINLEMENEILEVPEMVLENPVTGVMSQIVVGSDALVTTTETYHVKPTIAKEEVDLAFTTSPTGQEGTFRLYSISTSCAEDTTTVKFSTEKPRSINTTYPQIEITCKKKNDAKLSYFTEYMSEEEMLSVREENKTKVQYANSVYKCELCIIGFYTEQQVEDHFISEHRAKPGRSPCKVCYVYLDDIKLNEHIESHYVRHVCKLCGHREYTVKMMSLHAHARHRTPAPPQRTENKTKKKKTDLTAPKPKDLRKLLSKTTIEGYKCLECDMFFTTSRARKNHVARFHREGLQCDHCKKRFVNRTTLTTHLKLHEGPLPREECPICHKQVRVIQLKYHIQRHQSKSRLECKDCNKVFSHQATYEAHLKYSRAHASEEVFKFPCPMCNKGYMTKQAMQDHFNYQHLGKTTHKCPLCEKPLASRSNVDKHMMRVHGQKKERPRNHICPTCKKAFTDRKSLKQHLVIHSGERPLSCDVCQQTFKHKASLYTHRKRVHKVHVVRHEVQYMGPRPAAV